MALGCLALLFTLTERIACAEAVPLLSVRDLVELLDFYLPRKTRDPDQVLRTLRARHAATASPQETKKVSNKVELTGTENRGTADFADMRG